MAERIARPRRQPTSPSRTDRIFTALEERMDRLDRRTELLPATVDRIKAVGDRVQLLEKTVTGLAQTVLHEMLCWTCEECGAKNEIPSHFARYIFHWVCAGCNRVPREDFRQFHLHRHL